MATAPCCRRRYIVGDTATRMGAMQASMAVCGPNRTSINPGNSPCHALRISSCKSHTFSLSIWRLATSTWGPFLPGGPGIGPGSFV